MSSLLRHPTYAITRIIIELSTAKSSQVVPGTVRLLARDHPRQVRAFDATSLVIDSSAHLALQGPGGLNTGFMESNSTIQPHSGHSPEAPKADRTSALLRSPSHTKRLMLRNSGRPYPPIQSAQRWDGEPLVFAPPRRGKGFTGAAAHHQSNQMNPVAEYSNHLALRRNTFPSDAIVDPGIGIYQRVAAAAGDLSSVIGLEEILCPLAAPRAASHNAIASSHWSTTTRSNGELQAFPRHISSLYQSNQHDTSIITFPPTQIVPSLSHSLHQSYDRTTDAMEDGNFQSRPHIQPFLFFQPNQQLEHSQNDLPDLSFHKMPSLESGTDLSYHPMSSVPHAPTMPQCFDHLLGHGGNGPASASDYI